MRLWQATARRRGARAPILSPAPGNQPVVFVFQVFPATYLASVEAQLMPEDSSFEEARKSQGKPGK
jgi:hypothetical protein